MPELEIRKFILHVPEIKTLSKPILLS